MSISKHVGTHTVLFSLCLRFSIILTTIMIKNIKGLEIQLNDRVLA